ncbi:MAG: acylphosphatase [Deltaproteobacteria bacterium]|nr:acylphosphatase [Deltaproteobacteria bacterium]
MVRARLVISGVVQGVYFRANTAEVAERLGVCGWVRNNPDGTVEAVFEGGEEAVGKVIEWCRVGPPRARVDGVAVSWEAFQDEFDGFTALTRHTSY